MKEAKLTNSIRKCYRFHAKTSWILVEY